MIKFEAPKILDWDIETRPLSYTGWGNTDEITSIACSWYGEKKVYFFHLPPGLTTDFQYELAAIKMLDAFVDLYDQADIVTGHYIRNFDLPKVNGALIDNDLPILKPKMTSCTKNDLVKFGGLSKSQENLGMLLSKFNSKEFLGRKEHVSQMEWRQVNRLTREGVADNERRVTGDVKQHKEMREALLSAGLLRGPKVWRP
jgi:hypothetical protein